MLRTLVRSPEAMADVEHAQQCDGKHAAASAWRWHTLAFSFSAPACALGVLAAALPAAPDKSATALHFRPSILARSAESLPRVATRSSWAIFSKTLLLVFEQVQYRGLRRAA